MGLNKDDSTSVEKAQDLISDDNVKHSLIYINANFGTLADSITKLETSGLRLYDSIQIVQDILIKIESAAVNRIGNEIKNKFKAVLGKNTGFKTMSTISKILNDEEASSECFPDDFSADDLVHFRFAPITSVDVERSFSKYKYLLTDNRRSFTFDNIKYALIVQCNDFDF